MLNCNSSVILRLTIPEKLLEICCLLRRNDVSRTKCDCIEKKTLLPKYIKFNKWIETKPSKSTESLTEFVRQDQSVIFNKATYMLLHLRYLLINIQHFSYCYIDRLRLRAAADPNAGYNKGIERFFHVVIIIVPKECKIVTSIQESIALVYSRNKKIKINIMARLTNHFLNFV